MTSLPLFRFLFVCLGIFGFESLANAATLSAQQESPPIERESPLLSNQSFDTRGESTEVGPDVDVSHPVFLGKQDVMVRGNVGDLFAAGETVTIEGRVEGNAFIAARRVFLKGEVGDDLYAFAETVLISGHLEGDLYGAFEEVRVTPEAVVDGNLLVGGARVIIEGRVEGQLVGGAEEIRIDGYVGGDVKVAARSVVLSETTEIGGDLHYDTREEPVIPEGAVVHGETRRVRYQEEDREVRSSQSHSGLPPFVRPVLHFGAFLMSLLVGALCLLVGGESALLPSRLLAQRPAVGLGIGALVFFLTPIVAGLLIALCLTAPIGIVMLMALPVAMGLGMLSTSECVGRWVLGRGGRVPSALSCLIVGLVIFHALAYVPGLGVLICIGWSLAGLGVVFLALRGSRPSS